MTRILRHRGPDDEGFHFGPGIGLGHRRLSIIDLEGGRQPISNEDGSVVVVCNGEIYNYRTLRRELIERGHRFATRSDTEVIVHLYEELGTGCVEKLRGMFSFAVWDSRDRRLLLARDRLGQKPLFYAHHNGRMLFASEIKSILSICPSLRSVDLAAFDQYLRLRVIPPPRTMFSDISKLPPAHRLIYSEHGGITIERYWTLHYEPKFDDADEALLERLEQDLLECLQLHLIADVPVGAFMSGGLDSTLLVAMICAHGLGPDLHTFSVGLPYRQFDETPAARLVAERYGTRHHEHVIRPSLVDTLPSLVWHLDEPSDPLAVCQYLISAFAREHVKVVIGGEGGDELFGGYDRYYGNLYANYYAMVPHFIRKYALGPALRLLPDGRWYKSMSHQLKWMHHLSFHKDGDRYAKSLGYFYFHGSLHSQLYGKTMRTAITGVEGDTPIRQAYEDAFARAALDRMLAADSQIRLPDHPVMILDRMTMAHGLEARAPFMDHKLAEFAARLPTGLKVRGRTTRCIQRWLANKYLPKELLALPKQGFQSALPYMFKDEYTQLFTKYLQRSHLAEAGLLVQPTVSSILTAHLAGLADHGNRLWLLLNSELWYRMHIEGQSKGSLESEMADISEQIKHR